MTRERQQGRSRAPEKKRTVGYTGKAGLDRVEAETQRINDERSKTYLPFRYRAGWKRNDDFNPVIFLDNSLQDAFFFHEHGVQDARGNFGRQFEVCVRETDNCPLCKLVDGGAKNISRSNYMMLLTVLDLRPYENKDGETITHSRKLFAVKGLQIQEWINILQRAEKKFGTLRGVYVEIGRAGEKEAGTGKPLPLEKDWYGDDAGDVPYSNIEEKDLEKEYGHEAVMSDDGKRVIKEADADITPYAYADLFPFPDLAAMGRKYGLKTRNAGSQADIEDALEGEEERPRRGRATRGSEAEEETGRGRSRTAGRGRAAEPEDTEEEEEGIPQAENGEDDEAGEAPPPRTRQREAAAPAAKERSRSRAAPEEAPKGRERSRTAKDTEEAAPARGRTRTRPAAEDAEAENDEAEEAPRNRERVSARSRTAAKPAAAQKGRDRVADELDDEIPF